LPPRTAPTIQTDVSAVVRRGGSADTRLLLVRRPESGLWGGLWEFPRVTLGPGETPESGAERAAREVARLEVRAGQRLGIVKHGVTTRKITLIGVACAPVEGDDLAGGAAEEAHGAAWVTEGDLERYALAAPQVRLARQVTAPRTQPTLFEATGGA
jgi:A/G-specific adenine glycosylase